MMQNLVQKIQGLLPQKKIKVFKEQQLLHYSFPYYLLAAIMLVAFYSPLECGYLLIFVIYFILPFLDEFFSLDLRNPTEKERQELEKNDFNFKLCLYVTIVLDWVLFFKGMNLMANLQLNALNTFKLAGFLFIFSNLEAVQFAVAHEIFHKQGKFHRYLGTIHMIKNLYMHFTFEHLYGHHRRVGTPEDPASSLKGQSLYNFFPQTFFGSYKSVYKMQKEAGKPFYLNYSVLSVVASIAWTALMFYVYGLQGGIIFLILAAGAIFYLEAINYLEHYGLRRMKKPDGTYEKVTIKHSWNSPHRFSNYLLFKLQRHSDHHENSLKPYQTLVSLEDSPHLPHGYSVSIFMSFFPSVWFSVMDPLVDQYNKIKTGNIEGELMSKAKKLTRQFIIKCGIITGFLFISSLYIERILSSN